MNYSKSAFTIKLLTLFSILIFFVSPMIGKADPPDRSVQLLDKMAKGQLSPAEQIETAKLIKGNEVGGGVWMMPLPIQNGKYCGPGSMERMHCRLRSIWISYWIWSILGWTALVLGILVLFRILRKPPA